MTHLKMSGSFDAYLNQELQADPEFAGLYLQEAFGTLADPQERPASLLAIRQVIQAYGGFTKLAEETGLSRESLYRAFSAKGNPTLNTLLAVLRTFGMRLAAKPVKASADAPEVALSA